MPAPKRRRRSPANARSKRGGDVSMTVALDTELYERAKRCAAAEERSLAGLVRLALKEHVGASESKLGGRGGTD